MSSSPAELGTVIALYPLSANQGVITTSRYFVNPSTELNTRKMHISKSSVYFLLHRRIREQLIHIPEGRKNKIGKIGFSIQSGRLEIFGSRYPTCGVMLLQKNLKTGQWTVQHAEAGIAIAVMILNRSKNQFYPEMSEKAQHEIILQIAQEVWDGISSWANPQLF